MSSTGRAAWSARPPGWSSTPTCGSTPDCWRRVEAVTLTFTARLLGEDDPDPSDNSARLSINDEGEIGIEGQLGFTRIVLEAAEALQSSLTTLPARPVRFQPTEQPTTLVALEPRGPRDEDPSPTGTPTSVGAPTPSVTGGAGSPDATAPATTRSPQPTDGLDVRRCHLGADERAGGRSARRRRRRSRDDHPLRAARQGQGSRQGKAHGKHGKGVGKKTRTRQGQEGPSSRSSLSPSLRVGGPRMCPMLPDPWPAPTPSSPVRAEVSVPGSKSLTNRALVLAAVADGPSLVRNALRSRDTELMAAALESLGARVRLDGSDWHVTPADWHTSGSVECGLAGTVMRFVPVLAGLCAGAVRFDGDPHARRRPMSATIDTLRQLGVEVDDEGRGALPFTVRGTGQVTGGQVRLDASSSSQFVSALLLAGATVRARRRRTARRPTRALPAPPRHDGGGAARAGRAGRRLPARPLGGRAGAGAGPRRDRGARPVQRRALPRRGGGDPGRGDRARLADRDDPARGRPARAARADGRHQPARRARADPASRRSAAGHRPGHARDRRAGPRRRGPVRARLQPLPAARPRPHPRPRDRPAQRPHGGADRARLPGRGAPRRPGPEPRADARRALPHLRRPPDGPRRGRARAAGRGRRGGEHRHDGQDVPRLRAGVAVHADRRAHRRRDR